MRDHEDMNMTTLPTHEYHDLLEILSAHQDAAVYYKDLLIEVAEGKMSLDELKQYVQVNYLERGHDK